MAIATHFTDRNTKRLETYSYSAFLKFLGLHWEKPQYKKKHKRVFIPTDQELQTAINTGTKKSIIFSHFLYETGTRLNEAERLEWTDLDQERKKVTIKASKNGNSRTISKNFMERLIKLPIKNKRVFPKRSAVSFKLFPDFLV